MTTKSASLFLIFSVVLAVPSRATTIIPADLVELTRDARAIARGRVAALDSQWTDDRGTIETIVTLEVDHYLKGALGPTLRFRVPGGDLGRFRSIVVGAPEFAVDERIVVFLDARGPSVPHVLGFSQGVFRVARREDGAGWFVAAPAAAAAGPIVRGDPSRRTMPLDEFERRVRVLAGGAK